MFLRLTFDILNNFSLTATVVRNQLQMAKRDQSIRAQYENFARRGTFARHLKQIYAEINHKSRPCSRKQNLLAANISPAFHIIRCDVAGKL